MTAVPISLFVLTFFVYVAAVAIASDLHGSDAAGNGMAQGFGFLAGIVLWFLLGCLSLIASSRSSPPTWVRIMGPLAAVAAAASSLAAFNLLTDNFYRAKWPMAVFAVLPPMLAVLSAWGLSAGFQRVLPAPGFPAALFAAIAVLSALPWAATIYRGNHRESDLAAFADAAPQREQAQKDRDRARLDALTGNSPLREWLEFAGQPEFRDAVFEGIRNSPRRQEDAEEMFRTGSNYLLLYVPEMDLTLTPVVCEGSKRCLREIAKESRRNPAPGPIYFHDSQTIWQYCDGFRWVVEHGCDCHEEIQEFDQVARQYEDTAERQKFLEFLNSLRHGSARR